MAPKSTRDLSNTRENESTQQHEIPLSQEVARMSSAQAGRAAAAIGNGAVRVTDGINEVLPPLTIHSPAETLGRLAGWNIGSNLMTPMTQLHTDVADKHPVLFRGNVYPDKFSVPGNEPVPVIYPDSGQPVIGPDKQPVFAPSRADLPAAAAQFSAQLPGNGVGALMLFGHGAPYDFQRIHDDNGQVVFSSKYRDFANIAIGYAFAQNSMGTDIVAPIANTYCSVLQCKFNPKDTRSQDFTSLPQRDVDDYKIGANLWQHAQK
jgi:hypothetical protein